MEKINYNKAMESIISGFNGGKKSLLLHVCCAPCSSHCIDLLKNFFDITIFYYNPNIYPSHEFQKRRGEVFKLLECMDIHDIEIVTFKYDENEYLKFIQGYETEKEGGKRCALCFRLRMEKAAEYAASHGFDYYTTTLSISPHKNAALLNEIGLDIEQKYGIKYLPADFKKKEGYKHSVKMCLNYGIYRQDYCGCRFSLNSKEE